MWTDLPSDRGWAPHTEATLGSWENGISDREPAISQRKEAQAPKAVSLLSENCRPCVLRYCTQKQPEVSNTSADETSQGQTIQIAGIDL